MNKEFIPYFIFHWSPPNSLMNCVIQQFIAGMAITPTNSTAPQSCHPTPAAVSAAKPSPYMPRPKAEMLDAQTKRKRRVSLKVLIFIVYYFYVWSSSSAVQYQYQHYPIKCSQHHIAARATMANKPVTATRAEIRIPVSMNTSIKVGRSFILSRLFSLSITYSWTPSAGGS